MAEDIGGTRFVVRAQQGDTQELERRLSRGQHVNARHERFGYTALHAASGKGFTDMVAMLLRHGADVNLPRRFHLDTALHFAAHAGRAKVARILLEHGADKSLCNRLGQRPLETALQFRQRNVVELLADLPDKSDPVWVMDTGPFHAAFGAKASYADGLGIDHAEIDLLCLGDPDDPRVLDAMRNSRGTRGVAVTTETVGGRLVAEKWLPFTEPNPREALEGYRHGGDNEPEGSLLWLAHTHRKRGEPPDLFEWQRGTSKTYRTGHDLVLRVTRLAPARIFAVRSRCHSVAGYSPYSDWCLFATLPTVPNPPLPPVVISNTSHSFTIAWIPPRDNGSEVSSYRVEIFPCPPAAEAGKAVEENDYCDSGSTDISSSSSSESEREEEDAGPAGVSEVEGDDESASVASDGTDAEEILRRSAMPSSLADALEAASRKSAAPMEDTGGTVLSRKDPPKGRDRQTAMQNAAVADMKQELAGWRTPKTRLERAAERAKERGRRPPRRMSHVELDASVMVGTMEHADPANPKKRRGSIVPQVQGDTSAWDEMDEELKDATDRFELTGKQLPRAPLWADLPPGAPGTVDERLIRAAKASALIHEEGMYEDGFDPFAWRPWAKMEHDREVEIAHARAFDAERELEHHKEWLKDLDAKLDKAYPALAKARQSLELARAGILSPEEEAEEMIERANQEVFGGQLQTRSQAVEVVWFLERSAKPEGGQLSRPIVKPKVVTSLDVTRRALRDCCYSFWRRQERELRWKHREERSRRLFPKRKSSKLAPSGPLVAAPVVDEALVVADSRQVQFAEPEKRVKSRPPPPSRPVVESEDEDEEDQERPSVARARGKGRLGLVRDAPAIPGEEDYDDGEAFEDDAAAVDEAKRRRSIPRFGGQDGTMVAMAAAAGMNVQAIQEFRDSATKTRVEALRPKQPPKPKRTIPKRPAVRSSVAVGESKEEQGPVRVEAVLSSALAPAEQREGRDPAAPRSHASGYPFWEVVSNDVLALSVADRGYKTPYDHESLVIDPVTGSPFAVVGLNSQGVLRFSISGLNPGWGFRARISARNRFGWSAPSRRSFFVRLPDPPRLVEAFPDSIRVAWTPPLMMKAAAAAKFAFGAAAAAGEEEEGAVGDGAGSESTLTVQTNFRYQVQYQVRLGDVFDGVHADDPSITSDQDGDAQFVRMRMTSPWKTGTNPMSRPATAREQPEPGADDDDDDHGRPQRRGHQQGGAATRVKSKRVRRGSINQADPNDPMAANLWREDNAFVEGSGFVPEATIRGLFAGTRYIVRYRSWDGVQWSPWEASAVSSWLRTASDIPRCPSTTPLMLALSPYTAMLVLSFPRLHGADLVNIQIERRRVRISDKSKVEATGHLTKVGHDVRSLLADASDSDSDQERADDEADESLPPEQLEDIEGGYPEERLFRQDPFLAQAARRAAGRWKAVPSSKLFSLVVDALLQWRAWQRGGKGREPPKRLAPSLVKASKMLEEAVDLAQGNKSRSEEWSIVQDRVGITSPDTVASPWCASIHPVDALLASRVLFRDIPTAFLGPASERVGGRSSALDIFFRPAEADAVEPTRLHELLSVDAARAVAASGRLGPVGAEWSDDQVAMTIDALDRGWMAWETVVGQLARHFEVESDESIQSIPSGPEKSDEHVPTVASHALRQPKHLSHAVKWAVREAMGRAARCSWPLLGLRPGSKWQFRARIETTAGVSQWTPTSPVFSLPPDRPETPLIPLAAQNSPNSLVVGFSLPRSNGARIERFLLERMKVKSGMHPREIQEDGGLIDVTPEAIARGRALEPPGGVRWEPVPVKDPNVRDLLDESLLTSAQARSLLSRATDPKGQIVHGRKAVVVEIQGLYPGSIHVFRVTVFNRLGESAPSGVSGLIQVQPDVPERPDPPTLLAATSRSLYVRWTVPHNNGSNIFGFHLRCRRLYGFETAEQSDSGSDGEGFGPDTHQSWQDGSQLHTTFGSSHAQSTLEQIRRSRRRCRRERAGKAVASPRGALTSREGDAQISVIGGGLGREVNGVWGDWHDIDEGMIRIERAAAFLGGALEAARMEEEARRAERAKATGAVLPADVSAVVKRHDRVVEEHTSDPAAKTDHEMLHPPGDLSHVKAAPTEIVLGSIDKPGAGDKGFALDQAVGHRPTNAASDRDDGKDPPALRTGTELAWRISGLRPGARYEFEVSAWNHVGESQASEQSSLMRTLPEPCDRPLPPFAAVSGPGSVSLRWVMPSSNGSPLVAFRLQCRRVRGTGPARRWWRTHPHQVTEALIRKEVEAALARTHGTEYREGEDVGIAGSGEPDEGPMWRSRKGVERDPSRREDAIESFARNGSTAANAADILASDSESDSDEELFTLTTFSKGTQRYRGKAPTERLRSLERKSKDFKSRFKFLQRAEARQLRREHLERVRRDEEAAHARTGGQGATPALSGMVKAASSAPVDGPSVRRRQMQAGSEEGGSIEAQRWPAGKRLLVESEGTEGMKGGRKLLQSLPDQVESESSRAIAAANASTRVILPGEPFGVALGPTEGYGADEDGGSEESEDIEFPGTDPARYHCRGRWFDVPGAAIVPVETSLLTKLDDRTAPLPDNTTTARAAAQALKAAQAAVNSPASLQSGLPEEEPSGMLAWKSEGDSQGVLYGDEDDRDFLLSGHTLAALAPPVQHRLVERQRLGYARGVRGPVLRLTCGLTGRICRGFVSGLVAGHRYEFRVVPKTSIGWGLSSPPSNCVRMPSLTPARPVAPEVFAASPFALALRFAIPRSRGAIPVAFEICRRRVYGPADAENPSDDERDEATMRVPPVPWELEGSAVDHVGKHSARELEHPDEWAIGPQEEGSGPSLTGLYIISRDSHKRAGKTRGRIAPSSAAELQRHTPSWASGIDWDKDLSDVVRAGWRGADGWVMIARVSRPTAFSMIPKAPTLMPTAAQRGGGPPPLQNLRAPQLLRAAMHSAVGAFASASTSGKDGTVTEFHSGLTPRLASSKLAGRGPEASSSPTSENPRGVWEFGHIGQDPDNSAALARGLTVGVYGFFLCNQLPPRSAHQFRVRVISLLGPSEWSPPSLAVATIGAPPLPPKPPVMESHSDSIITIGWELGRANGYICDLCEVQVAEASTVRRMAIDDIELGSGLDPAYEAFVKANLKARAMAAGDKDALNVLSYDWTVVTRDCDELSYMVTGLRPATEYVFRVRAKSEAGWGAFSLPSAVMATKRRTF
jgi:hypothetical protein